VVSSGPDVGRCRGLASIAQVLTIGRDPGCWFRVSDPRLSRVSAELVVDEAGRLTVTPADDSVTVDGMEVAGPVGFGFGQVLGLGASTLRLQHPVSVATPGPEGLSGRVLFHRAPHRPAQVPPVVLPPLGEVPERPEPPAFAYLAALAPLVLGIGLAIVYSPRFLLFALLSPVVGAAGHLDQRRRSRRRFDKSVARFDERVTQRRLDVEAAVAIERRHRFEAAPDLAELQRRATGRTTELWARDRLAGDVLHLRIGLGDDVPVLRVEAETRGDETLRATLAADLAAAMSMHQVPIVLDLDHHGVCALVGAEVDTTALCASLIMQACCLHSPEDVVVAVAVEPGRRLGEWLKWLPHVGSAAGLLDRPPVATSPARADELLTQLVEVAEARHRGDGEAASGWPRFLVVVDRLLDPDPTLVARLLQLGPEVGMVVVWLTTGADRVPPQASVVIECADLLTPRPSVVTTTQAGAGSVEVEIDRLGADRANVMARSLAPLRDASSSSSSAALPREVTLNHALGVSAVNGDWVSTQWARSRRAGGRCLRAPLGLTASGPIVVDLVDHGPHGLIGGTSGAGKSELITSLVAGLMAHHPPDRLNVLFIDYKGGATTTAFVGAPHTVGCVTNLDPFLAQRALVSLRAELDRRMELLQGRARDLVEMVDRHPDHAPPSLVIVVDEFASLVKEVPDFVAGMVDLAQRGRSLGIHLLLATQRPSGAVNENILANTNLRIGLRMLSTAESTSVLGSADAATIPTMLKGRAFVRLGPGELVPFQTAWSGAPATTATSPGPVIVTPFTGFAGNGSRPPATGDHPDPDPDPDPGPGSGRQRARSAPTQLDGLLAAVSEAADRAGLPPPRSPWLAELPTRLELDDLVPPSELDRGVVVGLVDDPAAQAQYPLEIDFERGGLLVVGATGTGKTTALQTLAVAALTDGVRRCRPPTLFGLDFASRRLSALGALPSCAGMATGDDLEAVTRIVAVLGVELERRRQTLGATSRSRAAPPVFDPVLLLIDDYGALTQAFEGAGAGTTHHRWLERLNQLITDGHQVGIHTAVSATRPAAVRSSVRTALSCRLVLRQSDPGAYHDLGLSPSVAGGADSPPGRCVVEGPRVAQLAVVADPVPAIEDALDGPWPQPPDRLRTAPLPERAPLLDPTGDPWLVRVGVADLTNEPVDVDLATTDLSVIGDPRTGRSTTLATIAHQLVHCGREVWAVGPADSPLQQVPDVRSCHLSAGLADHLMALVARMAGEVIKPVLVVDDLDLLDDPGLDGPFQQVVAGGVRLVAATVSTRTYSTSPVVQALRKARAAIYLCPPGVREVQEATGVPVSIRPGLVLGPGRAVVVANRVPVVAAISDYFTATTPRQGSAEGPRRTRAGRSPVSRSPPGNRSRHRLSRVDHLA
jgi:S-DNA-T family DNA segregation ATPase FtsK/SpoIIIE